MSSKIIAGTTSGTALNMSADTSGILEVQTGSTPTTAITVDASQNVGIGTASPVSKLQVSGGAYPQLTIDDALTRTYGIGVTGAALTFYDRSASAERMRIDSSGNLLVGYATASASTRLRVKGASSTSGDYSVYFTNSSDTIQFYIRNDGYTNVGLLPVSPYNYSVTGRAAYLDASGGFGYLASVRAAKTNIENLNDVSWVYNLNPVEFNYRKKNEDNKFTNEFESEKHYGLVAEEVEKVNKELCFYDNDGTLRGVSYDKLTSVLLKAIQELNAKVDAQAAEIKALKGVA